MFADPGSGPVAFAGDWHGNTLWAVDTIVALAEKGVRVIVHCGDFGIWPGPQGHNYLRLVNNALIHCDITLGVVPGNHEYWNYLDQISLRRGFGLVRLGLSALTPSRIVYLPRGYRWAWSGVRFAAFGGAVSVDRHSRMEGVDWWPQERVTYGDVRRLVDAGPVDVLVCHDRPSGAPLPALEATRHLWPADVLAEADGHRELIQQAVDGTGARLIVHGHYHDHSHDRVPGGVTVIGLDRDGTTIARNTWVVRSTRELGELRSVIPRARPDRT